MQLAASSGHSHALPAATRCTPKQPQEAIPGIGPLTQPHRAPTSSTHSKLTMRHPQALTSAAAAAASSLLHRSSTHFPKAPLCSSSNLLHCHTHSPLRTLPPLPGTNSANTAASAPLPILAHPRRTRSQTPSSFWGTQALHRQSPTNRASSGTPALNSHYSLCSLSRFNSSSSSSRNSSKQLRTMSPSRALSGEATAAEPAKKKRGKGGKAGEEGAEAAGGEYKGSLNLPETTFGMRANSQEREPEIQKKWEELQVAEQLQQTNPGDVFTLHDGPPYANGDLHIGHALNKILKDIINRYQALQGRKVRYIPGWDCHGLPIELKVLQSMDSKARQELTPIKLRKKAAQFARKTVDKQRASFKRYGIWGAWDEPYLTLQPEYEAAQIGVFGSMFLQGHIYRGRKPVHWSPSSRTALAEAELEYPEGHTSRSMYAKFQFSHLSKELESALPASVSPNKLGVAIWTTTPWTIPGNAAVAVNDKLQYAVVRVSSPDDSQNDNENGEAGKPAEVAEGTAGAAGADGAGGADGAPSGPRFGKGMRNPGQVLKGIKEQGEDQFLVVALDLVERLEQKLQVKMEVVLTLPGAALEGSRYMHPLDTGRECPVVIGGDYITTESGTGLVHTAPGHGQEDYATGLKYSLPLLSPVDDRGWFTAEAGDEFQGLDVLGEGNVAVMGAMDLCGSLLLEERYEHKYPYDWRTKKPTIFRATDQWFASVEGFREAALAAIREVHWVPAQGEKRITAMTEDRSDWCISRQRSWGVPIPVFYHTETGVPLLNQDTLTHIQEIISAKGSDAWYEMEVVDLLPDALKDKAAEYRKGTDTMDVWFDSGSSWAAVLQQRDGVKWPADLYLEGSDQHRGWFQSSLLTSIASQGSAPYKQVLTHGFVLDEKGYKMSKSLGNVVDPSIVISGGKNQKTEPPYGADVLRLWVSSVDYSSDVIIGPGILRQMSDVYRKLRGTLRFMLGNLHGFNPSTDLVPYESLPALDQYALFRLGQVMEEVKRSYDDFQFFKFSQLIQRFSVVDLSNFYFDVCKDRLYVGGKSSASRRACQTVLYHHTLCMLGAMAPVLPHMAEDGWENLPFSVPASSAAGKATEEGTSAASVFLALWPTLQDSWSSLPSSEVAKWPVLLQVRAEVNRVMELARTGKLIGANLDAKVYLHTSNAELHSLLASLSDEGGQLKSGADNSVDNLRTIFLSSQACMVDSLSEVEKLGLEFSATANILLSTAPSETPNSNGSTLTATEGSAPTVGVGMAEAQEDCLLWIGVGRAEGAKCERCWNFSPSVGACDAHATLCDRCAAVVIDSGAESLKLPVAA